MRRRRPSRWHGLLPVYKLPGPTSHDVVEMARVALREQRIGHTGTLDPMAGGLLLLCVGQATRLQQYLLGWDKTYHGQIRLGYSTTTYDREGERTELAGPVPAIDDETLRSLEARFAGSIDQVPPPYSAKKVSGKKLYELARDGKEVEVEPKRVTVHGLTIEALEPDLLAVEIRASTGFYVRSLAHDIGIHLGCGAHLHRLERVRIGPYEAAAALPQGELEAGSDPECIVNGTRWVPLAEIALPFPEITLKPDAVKRFRNGQEVVVMRAGGDEPLEADSHVTVRAHGGSLLGVGRVDNVLARGRTASLRPSMVLAETQ